MNERHKTGGRTKGTPNKTTSELKNTLKSIIEKELADIDKKLQLLSPKDRLDIVVKMLPYVVPKQQHLDIGTEGSIIKIDLGSGIKPPED